MKPKACCHGDCSQGRSCPLATKYPTSRPIARVINSRAFAVACYIAALVAVLLANLEKFV